MGIGSDFPISIQSMTNTDTHDHAATLGQVRALEAAGCDISQINIKATTEEHLGFTGRLEGISAHAVCLIECLCTR